MSAILTNSAGQIFRLRGTTFIGRNKSCAVRLTGREVFPQHCIIIGLATGAELLTDLNSPGGTFLNQTRMVCPTELKAGDVIQVGRCQLVFGTEEMANPIVALAIQPATKPVSIQLTSTGVIAFSPHGLTVLWASKQAQLLLPQYYPTPAPTAVHREVTDWLARIAKQIKPEECRSRQQGRQLVLRLVERVGSYCLVVVSEENVFSAVNLARLLHLSGREGDVLLAIVMGLDRHSVGRALFISKRTVDKHCENLFLKLGVTDRAAAIRRVVSLPGFNLQ